MSYCRFGSNDLYLYDHVDGYICCCACRLTPRTAKTIFTTGAEQGHPLYSDGLDPCSDCRGNGCDRCCMHHDYKLYSYDDAIAHVLHHIEEGHRVSDHVIPSLEREARKERSRKRVGKPRSNAPARRSGRRSVIRPKNKILEIQTSSDPVDLLRHGISSMRPRRRKGIS